MLTEPGAFADVSEAIGGAKLTPEQAEVTMRPSTNVSLGLDDAKQMVQMLEVMEDLDDVQQVHSNADISEEILSQLE